MNPVGIDDILGKGRCDQNWQDPWERAAPGAGKQSAGDEEEVRSVIEGPAKRAHRTGSTCDGPVQKIRCQRHHHREQSENRMAQISSGHEERKRNH